MDHNVPKLTDDPKYAAALAGAARVNAELVKADAEYFAPQKRVDPFGEAEAAVKLAVDRGEPVAVNSLKTSHDPRAEVDERRTVLRQLRTAYRNAIVQETPHAQRRLIEASDLKARHQKLLQSFADGAQVFGRACAELEGFYDLIQRNDLGSSLGYFQWALNPGSPSDVNSNFHAWLRDVRNFGYEVVI